jgi:hypothetical protein
MKEYSETYYAHFSETAFDVEDPVVKALVVNKLIREQVKPDIVWKVTDAIEEIKDRLKKKGITSEVKFNVHYRIALHSDHFKATVEVQALDEEGIKKEEICLIYEKKYCYMNETYATIIGHKLAPYIELEDYYLSP